MRVTFDQLLAANVFEYYYTITDEDTDPVKLYRPIGQLVLVKTVWRLPIVVDVVEEDISGILRLRNANMDEYKVVSGTNSLFDVHLYSEIDSLDVIDV